MLREIPLALLSDDMILEIGRSWARESKLWDQHSVTVLEEALSRTRVHAEQPVIANLRNTPRDLNEPPIIRDDGEV